jgi:hypothetical protein
MELKREIFSFGVIIFASVSSLLGMIVLSDWLVGNQTERGVIKPSSETSDAGPQGIAAMITGKEPGWAALTLADFYNVNCLPNTWSEKESVIRCNGSCNGGFASNKSFKNFELLVQWKHERRSGNSGLFVWCPKKVLSEMKKNELPQGIEIQILDHGYAEDWEQAKGSPPNWFTTDGDVFPVGVAKMTPFKPAAPNGKRSFPKSRYSKGVGEWDQYYVRAINGEVRLWVNGHEVSGGSACDPAKGHLVLEAEGAPIQFRNMLIRELP